MEAVPAATADYAPTPRTTPSRKRDRARYDAATVHDILDSDFICHLGFVVDGAPVVLPTIYARVDGHLYLHGSSGSHPMREAADGGLAVCVTVTQPQSIVLARSATHHSVNYRSVVAHGTAVQVTDSEEVASAFAALLDHMVPGRAGDCRAPTPRERAMTTVLRLDLAEVSAKVRSGGVNDDPEDRGLAHWAGLLPMERGYRSPEPDPLLPPGIPVPAYLSALAR